MTFGCLDAASRDQAIDLLQRQGLLALTIETDRDIRISLRPGGPRPAKLRDLAVFCRQFATMTAAGVPILTGLSVLAQQSRDRVLRGVLASVVEDIQVGQSLTEAFRRHAPVLPVIFVDMIGAGETGGFIEEVFGRLADHFEREDHLNHKVKSALVYPAVVLTVAIGVMAFMLLFVLPNFVTLFSTLGAKQLPLPTVIMIKISELLRHWWYAWLLIVIALALLLTAALQSPEGRDYKDRASLRMPVFGDLVTKRSLGRLARTLATLLRSGVPVISALEVASRVSGNSVFAAAVDRAREEVRQGRSLAATLKEQGIFPPMFLEMLSVGEQTGAVDTLLYKLADFYDRDVERLMERLVTLIEPVMVVLLGVMVGLIIISIVLPMYDIFRQMEI